MKTGSEVATIIIPLLHSLLYSLPEIRDIFPPGLTQFHESRACISCSARSSPGQTSKATCKQVTALANPGKLFIHDIFWSKKLMCLSRGCLHCLFLTVCLLCFACRVTMYDYQAMCKVPYHHHSGARPLLSVCIVPKKPSLGWSPPAGQLQQSPKNLRRSLLSAPGTAQTHPRQISWSSGGH